MYRSKPAFMHSQQFKAALRQLCVVVFSVAFAYIEAAVVVYLRAIFHPEGFTFPLPNFGLGPLWKQFILIEMGREAATIVLILTSASLFGRTLRQRVAYFLIIFAVWDIFYYVWLKVLIGWPVSIMDWDVLFLIPVVWAGPVLAPLLVSAAMLLIGVKMLNICACAKPIKIDRVGWFGFIIAAFVVVLSFCIAGVRITEPDFRSHFHWLLFVAGMLSAAALFVRYLPRSK